MIPAFKVLYHFNRFPKIDVIQMSDDIDAQASTILILVVDLIFGAFITRPRP
jgi:hypothetical protein